MGAPPTQPLAPMGGGDWHTRPSLTLLATISVEVGHEAPGQSHRVRQLDLVLD